MLILNLTRGDSGIRVPLHLPATPADVGDVYAKLDQISKKEKLTRIASVVSDSKFLERYFRDKLLDPLDELNELAERLDSMDEQQLLTFEGALNAESINGLEDILHIADSLEDYLFIHGVTTEKELGEFLVASGYKEFSEAVKPYLDYAAIGKEYYAEHGGAFTVDGYILRRSSAQALAAEEKKEPIFRVNLQTREMRLQRVKPLMLELPAGETRMSYVKNALNIRDFSEATVESAYCVNRLFQQVFPLQSPDVSLLAELADNLSKIQAQGDEFKMLSVLSAKKPATLEDALRLTEELDAYEFLHISEEDYGKAVLLELCGDEEILDMLDGFIDWQNFGLCMMEQDGVISTQYGVIRRVEPEQPEQEAGMQLQGF